METIWSNCGVWSVVCGDQSADCKVERLECKAYSADVEYGAWSVTRRVKCGVQGVEC